MGRDPWGKGKSCLSETYSEKAKELIENDNQFVFGKDTEVLLLLDHSGLIRWLKRLKPFEVVHVLNANA